MTTNSVTSHSIRLRFDRYSIVDFAGLIYFSYLLSGDTSSRYLYLSSVLFVFWCLCALLCNYRMCNSIITKKKSAALLYHLVFIFCSGIAGGTLLFSLKQVGATILLFSPIFIYDYYKQIGPERVKRVLKLFIIPFVFFAIRASVFLRDNEGAARALAINRNAFGDIAIGGGYSLAYACALFGIAITSILVEGYVKRRFVRFLSIVFLLLCGLIVFQTRSTVTLLCFSFSLVYAFLHGKAKSESGVGKIILLFASAFIVLFFFLNISIISDLIIDISSSITSIVGKRLSSFANAMIGTDEGNYAIDRFSRPLDSFRVFLSHPLIGVAYLHGNGYVSSALYGVARHCEWVDTLANYGLLGGIPYLYIYVNQVVTEKKKTHIGDAWVLCLLLLGLFNPFRSNQANFVVFFVIPALNLLICNNASTREDNGT